MTKPIDDLVSYFAAIKHLRESADRQGIDPLERQEDCPPPHELMQYALYKAGLRETNRESVAFIQEHTVGCVCCRTALKSLNAYLLDKPLPEMPNDVEDPVGRWVKSDEPLVRNPKKSLDGSSAPARCPATVKPERRIRFGHILKAAVQGVLHQVPFVGPLIQAMESNAQESRLHAAIERLAGLIDQRKPLTAVGVSEDQFEADLCQLADSRDHAIASALLLAEAERTVHLAPPIIKSTASRFLYLAGATYASSLRTAEFATEYGFLWRSYHADRDDWVEKIPRVDRIKEGDLIVLGYRLKGPARFRVLLPLIVEMQGAFTQKIEGGPTCHHHAPYVLANPELARVLLAEDYEPDNVLGGQCGLNVRALSFDPSKTENASILNKEFGSPGKKAMWPYEELPVELRPSIEWP